MIRHFLTLITVSFIASGCASSQPAPGSGRYAWDGLGRDPNKVVRPRHRVAAPLAPTKAEKHDPNTEREKVLATLRPYSAAWWAVRDEMEEEETRRVNAKLVICRSCLTKPARDEYTASVRPDQARSGQPIAKGVGGPLAPLE